MKKKTLTKEELEETKKSIEEDFRDIYKFIKKQP